MSTALEQAIAVIAKRGAMRTVALAAELGLGENAVDAMLEPACVDGRLTTCRVVAGGRSVIEYRCSASGGSLKFSMTPSRKHYQPPTPPPAPRDAATVAQDAEPKRETNMSVRDKIKAALLAHGPMTTRQLVAYVPGVANLSQHAANGVVSGAFVKLGGEPKKTIYGLVGQTLAERKVVTEPEGENATTRPVATRKRAGKAKKKAASKAGKRAAKKAWKTRRAAAAATKVPPKSFRPALTADGAILFMGAKKGEFEIPRDETRALLRVVRGLTGPELVLAVGFIETLDRAEVAS